MTPSRQERIPATIPVFRLCSRSHTLWSHIFMNTSWQTGAVTLHNVTQHDASGHTSASAGRQADCCLRASKPSRCELCGVSFFLLFKKQINNIRHWTSTSLTHRASMDALNWSTSQRLALCASPTSRLHAQRERTSPTRRQGSRRRRSPGPFFLRRLSESSGQMMISQTQKKCAACNARGLRSA
jgi:hypothetical protein